MGIDDFKVTRVYRIITGAKLLIEFEREHHKRLPDTDYGFAMWQGWGELMRIAKRSAHIKPNKRYLSGE